MKALVHRLPAAAPQDVSALHEAIEAGTIDPARIVAVLGKTEGNGCVNDFTRGYATSALKQAIAERLGQTPSQVEQRVAFVMSGGTEGGLSPHWIVFEVRDAPPPPDASKSTAPKALAIGVAFTQAFAPEEVGRRAQAAATASAVREAMAAARIASPADVHYVQTARPQRGDP
jgi:cyanuric acid amidohydrolase